MDAANPLICQQLGLYFRYRALYFSLIVYFHFDFIFLYFNLICFHSIPLMPQITSSLLVP